MNKKKKRKNYPERNPVLIIFLQEENNTHMKKTHAQHGGSQLGCFTPGGALAPSLTQDGSIAR